MIPVLEFIVLHMTISYSIACAVKSRSLKQSDKWLATIFLLVFVLETIICESQVIIVRRPTALVLKTSDGAFLSEN